MLCCNTHDMLYDTMLYTITFWYVYLYMYIQVCIGIYVYLPNWNILSLVTFL